VALAEDEELAELYVDDDKPYRPALSEWDEQAALLAQVVDGITNLTHTVIAIVDKAPPMTPYPRPESALDRVRMRRARREYDELLELVERAKRRSQ
jgi:hypothetical protein